MTNTEDRLHDGIEHAIAIVEHYTGGRWDRRRRFNVVHTIQSPKQKNNITSLDPGCVGEWDEDERIVKLHTNLFDDPDRLQLTMLHEAVHMVYPDYSEEWAERTAREIVTLEEKAARLEQE